MSEVGEYRDRPVRPYVVTQGRTRPSRNTIRPETLLIVTDSPRRVPVSASSEERALLHMCQRLLSLVEVAVHLGLPVSVVSVVASDLVDAGLLALRSGGPQPWPCTGTAGRPGIELLQEVLDGLRKLR